MRVWRRAVGKVYRVLNADEFLLQVKMAIEDVPVVRNPVLVKLVVDDTVLEAGYRARCEVFVNDKIGNILIDDTDVYDQTLIDFVFQHTLESTGLLRGK